MASSPGHLSSVKPYWSFGKLHRDAKGAFFIELVEDPLVHALLLDLVFRIFVWTYANIRHNMHLSPVSSLLVPAAGAPLPY